MFKIIVFAGILILIMVGVLYLFYKHEINDFIHKRGVSSRQKDLEYLIKQKEREMKALGGSIYNEVEKHEIEVKIREYEEEIQSIRKG